MDDIAFVTSGDRRAVPPPESSGGRRTSAAGETERTSAVAPRTSPRRRRPEPRDFADQTAMWAAYAADLVGHPSRVHQVASVAAAKQVVREVGGVRNVYFIGHGAGCYYFRVRTSGTDIHPVPDAAFVTPLTFSSDGTPRIDRSDSRVNASYLLVEALAQAMGTSRAGHRIEFRACYLQPTTVHGIAAVMGRLQRGLRVVATGYRSYYVLASRGDGTWSSMLESPSGQMRRGSRVGGTAAPPPEILVRVGDGQATVDRPAAP